MCMSVRWLIDHHMRFSKNYPSSLVHLFLEQWRRKCGWRNNYCREKGTKKAKFKSWVRLFAFLSKLMLLEKTWIYFLSPPYLWVNSWVDWLFSLGSATCLNEGKFWIQTCCIPLNNWPCVTSCSWERDWVNIYTFRLCSLLFFHCFFLIQINQETLDIILSIRFSTLTGSDLISSMLDKPDVFANYVHEVIFPFWKLVPCLHVILFTQLRIMGVRLRSRASCVTVFFCFFYLTPIWGYSIFTPRFLLL